MLNKKKGMMAISQILILVIGIVAISYAIGSEIVVVSGGDPTRLPDPTAQPSLFERMYGYDEAANAPTGTEGTESWYFAQGGFIDGLISTAAWGLTAYGIAMMLSSLFGLEEGQADAFSASMGAGFFAGRGVFLLAEEGQLLLGDLAEALSIESSTLGWGAGILVAAIVFYVMYEEESEETFTFTCSPWSAPAGGKHCEECNEQGMLPCSEYQCKSLGQACELLNQGTDEEKCAWVNRRDVEYPIIKPLEAALRDNFVYKPDNTISPPDRGVIVWNQDSTTGCAKAFTPLSFGVDLNEPAQCKIDYLRKEKFEEMEFYFGGSNLFDYNHTQIMSLPGPSAFASENLTMQNDGDFELYVRCQDANGNANTATFVIKYCVEKGPDTTPPLIVTTNLLNNMPIAYNQTSVDLELYINEPADCKWSHIDQSYDDMEEDMVCSSSIMEMNAQMLYKCSTALTGLKNREDNNFYFRCRDKPLATQDRNTNQESYEFTLIGTQPLVISSVEPNETIRDSTEIVKVTLEAETFAGYKEGESTCYYSDTGEEDNYIMFFYEEEINSHIHSQDLHLPEGDYDYYIKCIDLGGNSDFKSVNFSVESDAEAPIVVRAYHEETYLKLITDEKAECVYDIVDCNYLFDDGTKMTVVDDTDHFTDWNTKIDFYIKCQDEYGNQPLPNQCSIITRPFELYEEED